MGRHLWQEIAFPATSEDAVRYLAEFARLGAVSIHYDRGYGESGRVVAYFRESR